MDPRGHIQIRQLNKYSRLIEKLIEIGSIVFSYAACRTSLNIIIYMLVISIIHGLDLFLFGLRTNF